MREKSRGAYKYRLKSTVIFGSPFCGAKAGGARLGNPRPQQETLKLANAAKADLKPAQHVLDTMMTWHGQGKGSRATARELNRLNITHAALRVVRLHRKAVSDRRKSAEAHSMSAIVFCRIEAETAPGSRLVCARRKPAPSPGPGENA